MPINMIASRRFYHKDDGKEYVTGQGFKAKDDRDADRYERQHKGTREPKPALPSAPEVKSAHVINNRAMTAERTAPPVVVPPVVAPAPPPAPVVVAPPVVEPEPVAPPPAVEPAPPADVVASEPAPAVPAPTETSQSDQSGRSNSGRRNNNYGRRDLRSKE